MNAVAHDVMDYLASSAGGSHGTVGVDLFAHYEPDSPDSCITVIGSGGTDADIHGNFSPTIQIRVRKNRGGFESAASTMQAIIEDLHASHGWTQASTYYLGCWMQGDIFYLGLDSKDRPVLSANFRLQRRAT